MQHISFILALDEQYGIGIDNQIPWHLSDDLKRFKELTMGHTVIMGRRTWESLPKRPLPGRRNMVISKQLKDESGCEIVDDPEKALKMVSDDAEVFIIGGAQLYKAMLPLATRLYLTQIHGIFNADTFFPKFDVEDFEEISRSEKLTDTKSGLQYTYVTLERKRFGQSL